MQRNRTEKYIWDGMTSITLYIMCCILIIKTILNMFRIIEINTFILQTTKQTAKQTVFNTCKHNGFLKENRIVP